MTTGVEDQEVVVGIEHLLHMNINDKAQEMEFLELGEYCVGVGNVFLPNDDDGVGVAFLLDNDDGVRVVFLLEDDGRVRVVNLLDENDQINNKTEPKAKKTLYTYTALILIFSLHSHTDPKNTQYYSSEALIQTWLVRRVLWMLLETRSLHRRC
ncbi:unnamed protein product [Vicia faba]|uniref:Uncharacterized protein n=1 Tax=Vicia faba TaxID=3906 RepID=A0AAV1A9R2_VICFA|nr:unnamed protein product [Vicia faba]